MSEQNPYKTLGLAESASFEEIQAAKLKLSQQHQNDSTLVESLEAAYDAIIMERLRQRQQGTLDVPDQIRFAETPKKSFELPKSIDSSNLPNWLVDLRDQPEPQDLNWSLGVNGAIAATGLFLDVSLASTILTALLVANIYLLYRKENRFGRAFLVGVSSLILGVAIGSGINALIASQGGSLAIAPEQILIITSCISGGLTSSFLR
ncbi:MAG: molecular chaperone DnaJ [Limnothrix sp. RL_2_0]|nr:molecular chaperone DnaJ [Limnothrix sp. RL_2_0]